MAKEKQLTKEEHIAILEKEIADVTQLQNDIKEASKKTYFPKPTNHLVQAIKAVYSSHFHFDAHKDQCQSIINKLQKG